MVSFTALVMVSSIVIGQAEVKHAMPAALQEQIETRIVGDWVFEGTYGEEKFTGVESWRWTSGKTSLIVEGQITMQGECSPYTYLGGWDSGKNAFVLTGYYSDGDSATLCWTEFTPERWSGRITGVLQGESFESPAKLEFAESSVRYEDTTAGKPWVSIARRPAPAELSDAQKAFDAYAKMAVGGTWVATVDDIQVEHTYDLILDGKFMMMTSTSSGDLLPWVAIVGVDPFTKQLTFWNFGADGGVSISTRRLVSDGVWLGETKGASLDGSSGSDTNRLINVDADTVTYEILEQTLSVEGTPPPEMSTWKRKR
jgi:hypothetical protein